MGKETLGHVEINEVKQNRPGLFIQSFLKHKSQPPSLVEVGTLVRDRKRGFSVPDWGCWHGGIVCWLTRTDTSLRLVGVRIWLFLINPKSEAETKIRKTLSYWLSPGHFRPIIKRVILFGFWNYFLEILTWHFPPVWLLGRWIPELVTEDSRLVSWTGCCS